MGQELSKEQREKVVAGVDARVHAATIKALPEARKRVDALLRQASEATTGEGAPFDPATRDELGVPEWYSNLQKKSDRKGVDTDADVSLARLKTAIAACKSAQPSEGVLRNMRALLHQLPFQRVTGQLLRNHFMMAPASGLPQLFHERYMVQAELPFDIIADAKELYLKWYNQVFETNLLHGIIPGFAGGLPDKFDPKYESSRQRADYHGHGSLVNGQWWPTQLASVRDGAHGLPIGGVYGHVKKGAYSCIMSDSPYPDEDYGERVLYCGTDSINGEISEYTKRLLESEELKEPVRLLRSEKMHSEYKPSSGLRYDGLYDVVSHEVMPEKPGQKKLLRHRFTLIRQADQGEIRGGSSSAVRPTQQEKEWYEKDRKNRGYK